MTTTEIVDDITFRNAYGVAAAHVQFIVDNGPPNQSAQQVLDVLLASEKLLTETVERNTDRALCKHCDKPIHNANHGVGWLHDVPSGRGIRGCRAASFDYLVGPGEEIWNNDLKRSWTARPA